MEQMCEHHEASTVVADRSKNAVLQQLAQEAADHQLPLEPNVKSHRFRKYATEFTLESYNDFCQQFDDDF